MVRLVMIQVLKQNAMRGRCKKPPMEEEEMMQLAKSLLYRKGKQGRAIRRVVHTWVVAGVDGLATFVEAEPYSRSYGGGKSGQVGYGDMGSNYGGWRGEGGRRERGGNGGGRGGRATGGGESEGQVARARVRLGGKSLKEKLALLCGDFNSAKGCSRAACIYMHKCSAVDNTKVCFGPHSKMQH